MDNETKIGKKELVSWVENLLGRKNFEFRDLKDGDVFLKLFEWIWPKIMRRFKGGIQEYPQNDMSRKKNWKLIRSVLDIVDIDKSFINYEGIIEDRFKECYQSLVVLYFLYSLVKHHECDFILAYPIDKKWTDFMSSEYPLTCLVKAGSVQLPQQMLQKFASSHLLEQLSRGEDPFDGFNINNKEDDIKEQELQLNLSNSKTNLKLYDYQRNGPSKKETALYKYNLQQEEEGEEEGGKNEKEENLEEEEENGNRSSTIEWKKYDDEYNNYDYHMDTDASYVRKNQPEEEHMMNQMKNRWNLEQENKKKFNEIDNRNGSVTRNIIQTMNMNRTGHSTNEETTNDILYERNIINRKYQNSIKEENNIHDVPYEICLNNEPLNEFNESFSSRNVNLIHQETYEPNERKQKNTSLDESMNSKSYDNLYNKFFSFQREGKGYSKEKDRIYQEPSQSPPSTGSLFSGIMANETKKNISLPDLNLFKHPFNRISQRNDSRGSSNTRKEKKIMKDNSCQTDKDNLLVDLLNDESHKNLEIKWNDTNQQIKGDAFIFFLKTQIQMYKKELTLKNEEIELMKKVHNKMLNDVKTSHNIEIKKLQEKYESELMYLKQQHLENIVIVRKNFESKLNHIEEDLLLDLDVLNCENQNAHEHRKTNRGNEAAKRERSNQQNLKEFSNEQTNADNPNHPISEGIDSKSTDHSLRCNASANHSYENERSRKEHSLFNQQEEIEQKRKNCEWNENGMKNQLNIEGAIKKLKYLLHEKNKEHASNNDFIKNEIFNLKSLLGKAIADKDKEYKNQKHNNEIFCEILESIESNDENCFSLENMSHVNEHTNVNHLNHIDNFSRETQQIEQIKNKIYNIIKERRDNNNISNDTFINDLNKHMLLNLIIHVGSLLHLERMKSKRMRIQKERNQYIMNYGKNKNTQEYGTWKTNGLYEEEKKNQLGKITSNEIQNREIQNIEIAMEIDDKLKKLEDKNRKLLSINEYYKKKLEHVEIWKNSLENFQNRLQNENSIYESEKNDNGNTKESSMSDTDLGSMDSSFIWTPEVYLKTFEEESERDAHLMYLLKMLGRHDKEVEATIYESVEFEGNDQNSQMREDRNHPFGFTNKNEFLVSMKKKLTYIFWQLIGDIYRYRNIIYEACKYIQSLNQVVHNITCTYEQKQKETQEQYEMCSKNRENYYLSEKYKLRKTIGMMKLHLDVSKEEYNEIKENYEQERKNFLVLTNTCYENENVKYKVTIQKFKEVDKHLKIYKAREKKWSKLVKLLTIEIRNSTKENQEEIKNTWLEILSTKNEIQEGKCGKNLKKEKGFTSLSKDSLSNLSSCNPEHNEKESKCDGSLNEKEREIQKESLKNQGGGIEKQSNDRTKGAIDTKGFLKKSQRKHGLLPWKHNENDKITKNKNTDGITNKYDINEEEMKEETNFYKNDFVTCLDEIEQNERSFFSATPEKDLLFYEKDSFFNELKMGEDGINEDWKSNSIIGERNEEDHNIFANGNINITNTNLTHMNSNRSKSTYFSSSIYSKNANNPNSNWCVTLSQMAKESCIMFQSLLKLKEEELNVKKNHIMELQNQLKEMKEQQLNQQNKYKCLEEQKETLEGKVQELRDTMNALNTQVFTLNKEKIYIESKYITKQQELNTMLSNYRQVINSIRNHIKTFPSILYLIDHLPYEDETIILNLTKIEDNETKNQMSSLNFSLAVPKNAVLNTKNNEANNEDIRIKINAKDSKLMNNFSKTFLAKTEERIIPNTNNHTNNISSIMYINDLIQDLKSDKF